MLNLAHLISIREIFDLLFVAGGIYFILFFIKQSRSYVLAYSVGTLTFFVFLIQFFKLNLAQQLLQILGPLILFIFVVVFQRELRQFFDWIFVSTRRLTFTNRHILSEDSSFVITKTIQELAEKKIGALVVFPGELPLEGVVEGGFVLDGRISGPLVLSLFDQSSPGHDGAMIIDNNRIKKFGAHLPLAENYSSFQKTGTRHRAAAGVTEKSDSLAVVVSEERGEISIAEHGKLEKIVEPHVLEDRISKFISQTKKQELSFFWQVFLIQNLRLKVLALVLAVVLWQIV